MPNTIAKEKYDQVTWLRIARKAMITGNFTKLTFTKVPFLLAYAFSRRGFHDSCG
jgi:hypothetical protein